MLSGYNDEVKMPVSNSRVAADARNGQSFEEIAGESEVEVNEAQINDYNFEEKSYSAYDLDSESLW
jgi:hypothetical protein